MTIEENRATYRELATACVGEGAPVLCEMTIYMPDGRVFELDMALAAIDKHGERITVRLVE